MKHIMVDLETLDNSSTSCIVSIGAVLFDFEKDEVYETWYLTVDANSCVKAGLTMSPDTVLWWLKQSDEARAMFKEQGSSLESALKLFGAWVQGHDPEGVWGNGADFDNVILATAYKAVGQKLPWKYYKNRCFRTMKNCFPVELKREGTHHNAVDDAVHQMKQLKLINTTYNLNLK